MHTLTCTHTCTHTHAYTCTHMHTDNGIYTHTHTCIHTHTHTHTCIHTHTHTIHTHADTHTLAYAQTHTESAGGVVVTTSACHAGGTGSIPGTGSCDIKIWFSTLGTVSLMNRRITLMSVPSQFGT